MESVLHKALDATVRKLLRPLVRVLLDHGVAHGAFADLSRQVFVEEGFAYLERSGQRATVSGVAALTGLSRKEVKRLRELDPDGAGESAQRYNRAVRVISGWVNDPRFSCEGVPLDLSLENGPESFAELVRDYSGDVPPAAMLALLQASGNVLVDDGEVTLVERAYIPMSTPLDRLNILGTDSAELIGTIGHNLRAEPDGRWFQRKVSNALVRRDAVEDFRALSNRRSQELLEEYDAWLSEHEVDEPEHQGDMAAYVAVGIYYVEAFE